jgi:AmmeMemoRadiSam system protein A/AmmeMemoRadiSam system protein B
MGIVGVYLMPHPPIIVPEVGRGEEKKLQNTIQALQTCTRHIENQKPQTVIVITPHGPVFQDGIAIMAGKQLSGDLSRFRAGKVSMSFDNDLELVEAIMEESQQLNIPCVEIDKNVISHYKIPMSMDWGAIVPLYFVTQHYKDFDLIHITISLLPYEELYIFGTAIQKAVESVNRDVCIIASGDLSHCLTEDGPYGFHPMGPKLDKEIIRLLSAGDAKGLLNIDSVMVKEGRECGLRSVIIAMGSLDGYDLKSQVLSYEGPFGVGYGVAMLEKGQKNRERELANELFQLKHEYMDKVRQEEDPYVSIARRSLETYIKTGKIIRAEKTLPNKLLKERAGVFVSLKKHGQLRGCIGTIAPTRESIAYEIIHNAISAGVRDPRFMPVQEDELDELVYSVDVLKEAETVKSIEYLDVKKYGVIVRSGQKTGLLLPNLEGVNSPKEQVEIALNKAGIRPDEDYTIERFEVERHS